MVCEPEQATIMMGALHPRGSLFERPVNIEIAKAQHAEFRAQVRVLRLGVDGGGLLFERTGPDGCCALRTMLSLFPRPASQLRAHGVKVLTVREILAFDVEVRTPPQHRVDAPTTDGK